MNGVIKKLTCAALACFLMMSMVLCAFAADPSVEKKEEILVSYEVVDSEGNPIGCIILDEDVFGDVNDPEVARNTPHIDTIDDCFIKITPLQQAEKANAAAQLLDMTEEELMALATGTGIGYPVNQRLIDLALKLLELGNIPAFIDQTAVDATQKVHAFLDAEMDTDAQKDLNNYEVAYMFDISANARAIEDHKDNAKVDVVMKVDGIKVGQKMFVQYINPDGTVEFIPAECKVDGEVSFEFTVGNNGPYVLYAFAG